MSCDDLLTKFDDSVKRIYEDFHEIVEGERKKLKTEVEAHNGEKKNMKAVVVSDDDIINLNVGGQKFTTTKSTLCQVKNSLLASMFDGRLEDSVPRDQDGDVFFDHNPKYFGFILDYLRAKKVATFDYPAPLPNIPEDQIKNFQNLVRYLGLSEEIPPTKTVLKDRFSNSRGRHVNVLENSKLATALKNSSNTDNYVLGENTYQQGQGIVRFKLNIQAPQQIFIGVLAGDVDPRSQQRGCSYHLSGSYGWMLEKNSFSVFKDGSSEEETSLNGLLEAMKDDDITDLALGCDAGRLSLRLPTGHQSLIHIPNFKTWRLHVNLSKENDKIRIVEVYRS